LFRKKPIVIRAEQFLPREFPLPFQKQGVCCYDAEGRWYVDTLEGRMSLTEGDWVIQGVNGEFYPCKPDIFEKTYERVNDA
jgi:hypothetical protein